VTLRTPAWDSATKARKHENQIGSLVRTIVMVVALTVTLHAEVMDKEPTALVYWSWSIVGGVGAIAAWRCRWWAGLPVSAFVLVCLLAVCLEVLDPAVGPAIRREAGQTYVRQFFLAAAIGIVLQAVAVFPSIKQFCRFVFSCFRG
jgi:hypothetical protein